MSTSILLINNVHNGIETSVKGKSYLVTGTYEYYHYLCDGFDDKGWGCGYRTLQTICSWMNHSCQIKRDVPSIREIQKILVDNKDKPYTFLNSRQWIGSFEVCLVIDKLYDIPCKIIHVNKGKQLASIIEIIKVHFEQFGSPIMMGGDADCSSKGIMGIHISASDAYLLVVDPHYVGKTQSKEALQKNGWVKWQPIHDFMANSFYNLCLPQVRLQQQ